MEIIFDDKILSKYTNIPGIYNNDYFIVDASVNTDSDIKQCGSLHLYIDLPEIQNVRIFTKIILLNQPHLVRFENINTDFHLAFEKFKNFNNIDLKIYRTMGLTFQPQTNPVLASAANKSTVASTSVSTVLLPANPDRKGFVIVNNSNRDLYIDYATFVSASDFAQQIPKIAAGMTATFTNNSYSGIVTGIWSAIGSGGAIIRELT